MEAEETSTTFDNFRFDTWQDTETVIWRSETNIRRGWDGKNYPTVGGSSRYIEAVQFLARAATLARRSRNGVAEIERNGRETMEERPFHGEEEISIIVHSLDDNAGLLVVVQSVWNDHLEKNCEQIKLTSPRDDAFRFFRCTHVQVSSLWSFKYFDNLWETYARDKYLQTRFAFYQYRRKCFG